MYIMRACDVYLHSSELEAKIREVEQSLLLERDVRDTESHSLKVEIQALSRSLELVKTEYESLTRVAVKIVANARDFPQYGGGQIDPKDNDIIEKLVN